MVMGLVCSSQKHFDSLFPISRFWLSLQANPSLPCWCLLDFCVKWEMLSSSPYVPCLPSLHPSCPRPSSSGGRETNPPSLKSHYPAILLPFLDRPVPTCPFLKLCLLCVALPQALLSSSHPRLGLNTKPNTTQLKDALVTFAVFHPSSFSHVGITILLGLVEGSCYCRHACIWSPDALWDRCCKSAGSSPPSGLPSPVCLNSR